MKNINYNFSFQSSKPPENLFETLLNIRKWWSGLYEEKSSGSSNKVNDEFIFKAGGGTHYSKQKLVELVPNKKIVWLVTESNLTFANPTDEWTGTKIRFEISKSGNKSTVTFTHQGLVPRFKCYDGCAGAWTQYLQTLAEKLK